MPIDVGKKKQIRDNTLRTYCTECGSPSRYLFCQRCKDGWKTKARKLFDDGVEPLSISVRLNKSWRDIVAFLVEEGLVEAGAWDIPSNRFFNIVRRRRDP